MDLTRLRKLLIKAVGTTPSGTRSEGEWGGREASSQGTPLKERSAGIAS